MIQPGNPEVLGATADAHGTNFAVYSAVAERVELCLFDAAGNQQVLYLPERTNGVWHGYLPGCAPGQLYGYRVHGPFDYQAGLRCNAAKLLLDPYAREIVGDFCWHPAVFDYVLDKDGAPKVNSVDSAPYVPKCVVSGAVDTAASAHPRVPWGETIIYECNVRGFSMCHPALEEASRGTFEGLRHKDVIAHLKSLGITAVELLPVQMFIDEHHLVKKKLRNFWGYNSVGFFAPMQRYARGNAVAEFRDMVRTLHDAGLEVIMDVAYNHTGEADHRGPTLCFRGLDNRTYYRTEAGDPSRCINDTGCGNTVNTDHVRVRQLILDSLDYWSGTMGVDGFRFDLASILGRRSDGFSPTHPFLAEISNLPGLRDAKLIAEPWDPGPGGYQLGHFPPRWSEWNDRFRDATRSFWRGDAGTSGEFAQRLHGSADLFEASQRPPFASVNFITSHDGFTLLDTVSYEHRHNLANGEENRDGHAHNLSANYGVEGPTDDPGITLIRHRQRLNLLASLLFSQGTPMLLAGDELGNSQDGNNNAYAQDNETGWLDWSNADSEFTDAVRELIWLRRETRLLRLTDYLHGTLRLENSTIQNRWVNREGKIKQSHEWESSNAFSVLIEEKAASGDAAVAILINRDDSATVLRLPISESQIDWRLAFSSGDNEEVAVNGLDIAVPALSITLLTAN